MLRALHFTPPGQRPPANAPHLSPCPPRRQVEKKAYLVLPDQAAAAFGAGTLAFYVAKGLVVKVRT